MLAVEQGARGLVGVGDVQCRSVGGGEKTFIGMGVWVQK